MSGIYRSLPQWIMHVSGRWCNICKSIMTDFAFNGWFRRRRRADFRRSWLQRSTGLRMSSRTSLATRRTATPKKPPRSSCLSPSSSVCLGFGSCPSPSISVRPCVLYPSCVIIRRAHKTSTSSSSSDDDTLGTALQKAAKATKPKASTPKPKASNPKHPAPKSPKTYAPLLLCPAPRW